MTRDSFLHWPPPSSHPETPTVVLIGCESVGKTAIFRTLTRNAAADETNVMGSTVHCRLAPAYEMPFSITDTPGLRFDDDSLTTRLSLSAMQEADVVLLVVRATHASAELSALLPRLRSSLLGRRVAVALSFRDKAKTQVSQLRPFEEALGVPVVALNARKASASEVQALETALRDAPPFNASASVELPPDPPASVQRPWLARPAVALAAIALFYGLPVYAAYLFSEWAQPLAEAALLSPLQEALTKHFAPESLGSDLLIGSYGVLTLGAYSFLWAFPVVFLLGISVALCDESGLRDHMASALDPWLRRVGLEGRDVAPLLAGFGCNVVAVVQSRSCGTCTRRACMSMIAFGSACSYQMGATLSLFGSGGHPELFLPYLAALVFVGAVHTRLWHARALPRFRLKLATDTILQWPAGRAVIWKVKASMRQFLISAMPIFMGICLLSALLAHVGVTTWLAARLAPLMQLFALPPEAALGVALSAIRKDGLLVLNEGGGERLASMDSGQLFVLVYLASTLTACLVTLWTIRREAGFRFALALAGRQVLTATLSSALIAWGVRAL